MSTATEEQPKIVSLELHEIEDSQATQARVSINEQKVEEYGQTMKDGVKFDPIVVFYDGVFYHLADGWHRMEAHRWASRKKINCRVFRGSQRDAIWYAMGANTGHGLQLSSADKRRAVEIALDDAEWSKLSDRDLGKHCGCHHSTVQAIRKEQVTATTSEETEVAESATAQDSPESSRNSASEPTDAEDPEETEAEEPDEEGDAEDAILGQLQGEYRALCNQLSAVGKKLREMAADEGNGGHLRSAITRLTTNVQTLRGTIRQMEPMQWCPHCNADGCKQCANTGFQTRCYVESRKEVS